MESPKTNPDQIFTDFWNKKADEWIKEVQSANFSEELEAKLTFFIDKLFISDYVEVTERYPKQLEIFLLSFYEAIQDSGESQGKKKFDIFNNVKDALTLLAKTEKLKKEN